MDILVVLHENLKKAVFQALFKKQKNEDDFYSKNEKMILINSIRG